MKQGQKVKLTQAWRTYSKGAVLEQGYAVDLQQLVDAGIAVSVVESGAENRPAKLAGKAARKIADHAKSLFGQQ